MSILNFVYTHKKSKISSKEDAGRFLQCIDCVIVIDTINLLFMITMINTYLYRDDIVYLHR